MQEAYGGIVNLVFIALFLVIISGILGLIVSYTKAFRMKNIVISTIEQYEASHCDDETSACFAKIKEGANSIHYAPHSLNCNGFNSSKDPNVGGLYCFEEKSTIPADSNHKTRRIYTIKTQVDIDIPIISRIFGFSMFSVTGDTHEIEEP